MVQVDSTFRGGEVMSNTRRMLQLLAIITMLCPDAFAAPAEKGAEKKANAWYQQQPWLVGSNYIPATAINELEMWQADSFDPQRIDTELGWAQGFGMNPM